MPDTTGPRSNRNPILADFRRQHGRSRSAVIAHYWAKKLTGVDAPAWWWLLDATVSQQVFAARVLYRYAAVFGGAS